jgi:hypothetical protein
MQAEVDKLDQAIAALQMLVGNAAVARTKPRRSAHAKKARRAKRKISREGLQNICSKQAVGEGESGCQEERESALWKEGLETVGDKMRTCRTTKLATWS